MGLLKQPDKQKLPSGTIEKHCERWCTSSRSAVTRRVSRLDSNRSVRRVTANYGQPKAVGARESNDASVQHAAFDSTRGVCRMVLVFYVMLASFQLLVQEQGKERPAKIKRRLHCTVLDPCEAHPRGAIKNDNGHTFGNGEPNISRTAHA